MADIDYMHLMILGRDADVKAKILGEIVKERARQDEKHGDQRTLSKEKWGMILGEEFGEVCNATFSDGVGDLREELIQVAAVAVAWVEAIDDGRQG